MNLNEDNNGIIFFQIYHLSHIRSTLSKVMQFLVMSVKDLTSKEGKEVSGLLKEHSKRTFLKILTEHNTLIEYQKESPGRSALETCARIAKHHNTLAYCRKRG